jgi:hypothetical protein
LAAKLLILSHVVESAFPVHYVFSETGSISNEMDIPMIEQLHGFPENTVAFACHGHVTRGDYQKTLIPAVEQAFAAHEKVRLYYEIGHDFEHVDPAAVWADFETRLGHWLSWDRIAIVTDVEWIRNTMSAFRFVMPGEIRLFSMSEKTDARYWISSDQS